MRDDSMGRGWRCVGRLAMTLASVAAAATVVPRWICGRAAGAYFDGDVEVQDALGREVARDMLAQTGLHFYRTGASRFDGQSAIAIYQMAIMGMGQIVREHPERPELREAYLPAMRAAADRMVDPATLRYAAERWGRNGIDGMGAGQQGEGHAYLGYVNLALGMLRAVDPATPHAALHDRLTAALAERLARAPGGLIETYPGETWPPDVAAVAGSIGLHAEVTGTDRRAMLAAWAARFEACAVHAASGYLIQRVRSGTCTPMQAPRGSGTAVASYFIGFADRALARRLYEAAVGRGSGRRSWLGFGGVREYAPGFHGRGDGNSGPVVAGVSIGATGFALAAARAQGDREAFRELYRSAALVGVPVDARGGRTRFATGGVLGNALLLAMLTAPRLGGGE